VTGAPLQTGSCQTTTATVGDLKCTSGVAGASGTPAPVDVCSAAEYGPHCHSTALLSFSYNVFNGSPIAHTRLPSLGFRSRSPFMAVSGQVTGVKPGSRLPLLSARPAVTLATLKRGCYQFCCLVNRGTMGVSSLPKAVTRRRRDCDSNPGTSAR